MKRILYILAAIGFIFTSCDKSELVETTPYTKVIDGDPNYSYVKFLNITPGSPSVNFYVNDVKISGVYSSASTETGYGYAGLFPDVGYVALKPGNNTLKANIVSSAATDKNLNVFSSTVNMEAGKYFSIFTTGVYNATDKKIESSLVVQDVKPALDTGKIFVRVVNLYSGGPKLDLIQAGSGEKIISNVAYNTASEFVTIPNPGVANVYNIGNAETNAVLKASLFSLTLTKGRAYTFIIRGISGSTTYPLAGTYYTTFLK